MQWRRQRRISHVIGSSNHALLIARYQDAPPGEEDEEEEVHNGYQMENRNGSVKGERNMQGGYSSYKRTRPYNSSTNTYGYGYGSLYNGQSKSSQPKEEDTTKPKIVFNEEEYMRITTPRQDVLFKKGYLSRKKPLASTASTSATSATTTPSTNESQSAAHSTADGSETAEDQQLLDGSNGGDFAIVPEPAAQLAYGGFYDQVTGYYYEYPVMLVGPPVPGHPSPNVLAAMSCGPVPLRPVEWFNPQYMPESLQEQHPPPHSTDSQAGSCGSSVSMDEVGGTGAPANVELVNEVENGEKEITEDSEAKVLNETTTECVTPAQIIPQIVPHMHMPPQHYIYPGHFMFGPPMMNMNGVTVQNGAIVPSEALWAKRRKKKKRRKQRRPFAVGNTEDEEEEYSSEWESGSNWSQPAWSANSTTAGATNDVVTSRPLNPEVQEFRFRARLSVLPDASDAVPDSEEVGTPLVAPSGKFEEENCEKTETENEVRIVPSDGETPTNNVNANLKDKLTENTLDNERVEDKNDIDGRIPDLTEPETVVSDPAEKPQSVRNGEIIQDEFQTKNLIPNETDIVPKDEDKKIDNGVSVNEVDEKAEVTNGVEKEVTVDHKNGVISENEISENLSEEAVGVDNSSECRELILPKNNGNLLSKEEEEVDNKNANNSVDKNGKEPLELNGNNTNTVKLLETSNESNPRQVSVNKKPDNETSNNKKGGNKNVKKGKGKTMDVRKPARNKRETRNPQRNDTTTSRAAATDSLQETDRSPSPSKDTDNTKSESPLAKPSSRPTSPEINQTTTPINADIDRLPGSYESSIARSEPASTTPPPPTSSGTPIAPPRRKYSAKGLKFVREPTPGPDLDTDLKSDNEDSSKINDQLRPHEHNIDIASKDQLDNTEISDDTTAADEKNENYKHEELLFIEGSAASVSDKKESDNKNSVDRIENRSEIKSTGDEEECSKAILKCENNSDNDNAADDRDDDTTSKLSEHPITDAVAAWLERTKSPEIFRIPMPISDSDDSELSEAEMYDGDPNREPSKNLKGNPMPALSVSNGSIDDTEIMNRSSVVASGNSTKTDTFDNSNTIKRRREKDIDNKEQISQNYQDRKPNDEVSRSVRVCRITDEGSAAGMRVAENSRVELNRVNTDEIRLKDFSNIKQIENIEMKVKSNVTSNDCVTENGIEALENVKTYERGEIVVLDGRLLTGTTYEPTCSKKSDLQGQRVTVEASESNNNQQDSNKNDRRSINLDEPFKIRGNSEHEMSPEGTVNSLGSIEEPDVLECWETEIIEPVVILKNNGKTMKLQVDGEVHDGEATEEENYDNCRDPATREHVKKYYRLAKEYTLSIDEELSEKAAYKQMNGNRTNSVSNSPQRTTPNTPERMIECLCSEEIPIIVPVQRNTSTKMNNVLVKDSKEEVEPVDEAFEVYESCYTEKTRLSGISQLNVEGSKIPLHNQEGPIPCKAVCCNIQ